MVALLKIMLKVEKLNQSAHQLFWGIRSWHFKNALAQPCLPTACLHEGKEKQIKI